MFESVRTRLTLWYVLVLALVLIFFSLVVYASLSHGLYTDVDTLLNSTADGAAVAVLHEMKEGQTLAAAAKYALDEHISPRQAAAIFDAHGTLIAENTSLTGLHAPSAPSISTSETGPTLLTTAESNERDRKRILVKRFATPDVYTVVVSQPLDEVIQSLNRIRLILLISVLLVLVLAGTGGWFLARRSLSPIVQMMDQARKISAENLEQRLPISNEHDELGRLAATFNELLGRLDQSLAQQRRFMADASHELRTPLSVIRTATSVTLDKKRDQEEYREALEVVDEQARRLTRIVADMFTLARADACRRPLLTDDFFLDELVSECVRAAEFLALRKNITLVADKLPLIPYRGDEGLLRQLVLNLLDNAIKNTAPHGQVRVFLERNDSECSIGVSDSGGGVPLEAQPHIFERFYRVDKSRSRTEASELGAGAGLGLSIARWIAEIHRGHLDLLASNDFGSVFVASLPLAKA